MNENNLIHWLSLSHAPSLGVAGTHKLIDHFGSVEAILSSGTARLKQAGLKQATIDFLQQPPADAFDADLEWAQARDHHLITLDDARYPERLKALPQAPLLLYVWGDPDYLQQPQLAMVGSRNPTAAGRKNAYDFASYLSAAGITITSGLARGIDAACHQGAVKNIAGTIALVAHGLDMIYPAEHRKMAAEIAANGAVVSELPIGARPQRGFFPRRNRIISGLSTGTLVVEAALKSGSLITARHALEQGRDVFAMPGSIHNPLARGCHQLIRQGAKLVETADDILEELAQILPAVRNEHVQSDETNSEQDVEYTDRTLDRDHQKLLKCLQFEPAAIDELVECSGFTAAEIASMLLILELNGDVVCDAGRYVRIT